MKEDIPIKYLDIASKIHLELNNPRAIRGEIAKFLIEFEKECEKKAAAKASIYVNAILENEIKTKKI